MHHRCIRALLLVGLMLSTERVSAQRGGLSGSGNSGSSLPGQRWGTPGIRGPQNYLPVPGRPSSSPKWSLRPPTPEQRSAIRSYGTAPAGRRSYSTAPGYIQHSHPPAGAVYGHHHHHGHYGDLNYLYGLPHGGIGYGAFYPSIYAPSTFLPPELNSVATYNVLHIPTAPQPQHVQPAPAATLHGEMLSRPVVPEERPLLDEFGQAKIPQIGQAGTLDRIRSLRYQTTGDYEFQQRNYAAAAVQYQAAHDVAPARRAPVLRLAWCQVVQRQHADAAANLKKMLQMPADVTTVWIDGKVLYGDHFGTDDVRHSEPLWTWLQEVPNSIDRLLLVAAFEKLRRNDAVADELLQLALRLGLSDQTRHRLDQLARDARANSSPAQQPASDEPAAINIDGRSALPALPVGPPQPLTTPQEQKEIPVPLPKLESR